jgi:hypothetical protein
VARPEAERPLRPRPFRDGVATSDFDFEARVVSVPLASSVAAPAAAADRAFALRALSLARDLLAMAGQDSHQPVRTRSPERRVEASGAQGATTTIKAPWALVCW